MVAFVGLISCYSSTSRDQKCSGAWQETEKVPKKHLEDAKNRKALTLLEIWKAGEEVTDEANTKGKQKETTNAYTAVGAFDYSSSSGSGSSCPRRSISSSRGGSAVGGPSVGPNGQAHQRPRFECARYAYITKNSHASDHDYSHLPAGGPCLWLGCNKRLKNAAVGAVKAHIMEQHVGPCLWRGCNKRLKNAAVGAVKAHIMEQHNTEEITTDDRDAVCHWPGCSEEGVKPSNLGKHLRDHNKSANTNTDQYVD
ncbi:Pre-mRNA-splicing factor cef1 [Hypoxylon texense]